MFLYGKIYYLHFKVFYRSTSRRYKVAARFSWLLEAQKTHLTQYNKELLPLVNKHQFFEKIRTIHFQITSQAGILVSLVELIFEKNIELRQTLNCFLRGKFYAVVGQSVLFIHLKQEQVEFLTLKALNKCSIFLSLYQKELCRAFAKRNLVDLFKRYYLDYLEIFVGQYKRLFTRQQDSLLTFAVAFNKEDVVTKHTSNVVHNLLFLQLFDDEIVRPNIKIIVIYLGDAFFL